MEITIEHERRGYKTFDMREDFSSRHQHFLMRKSLSQGSGEAIFDADVCKRGKC